MRLRLVVGVSSCWLVLAVPFPPSPAAASSLYVCTALGIAAPGAASMLNLLGGSSGCIPVVGGALTLAGQLNPAADPGTQPGVTTYVYDTSGRLSSASGSVGTATFTYDSGGRMSQATDALGRTTTYEYDGTSRLIRSTDYSSNTTDYSYDTVDRLAQTIDGGSGRTITFQYDGVHNRVEQLSDNLGRVTRYEYDSVDRLIRTIDDGVDVTEYRYDGASNRIIEVQDPASQRTTYFYDGFDRMIQTIDPLGHVTRYEYDSVSRLTSSSDPDGVTGFVYVAPVPEPGTFVLLGAGLLGLGAARRRLRAPKPESAQTA